MWVFANFFIFYMIYLATTYIVFGYLIDSKFRDARHFISSSDYPVFDSISGILNLWIISLLVLYSIYKLRRSLREAYAHYQMHSEDQTMAWLRQRTVEIECKVVFDYSYWSHFDRQSLANSIHLEGTGNSRLQSQKSSVLCNYTGLRQTIQTRAEKTAYGSKTKDLWIE